MKLVRFALQNPHWIIVFALAILLLGIVAVIQMPKDILPLFRVPAVQILTLYPGMPAEVMEQDITSRLERWTGQSVGIEHQESRSMLGVSVVRDFFQPNIDFNTALAQVSSYANSDLYYLPPGTVPPMVMPFDPTASVPLVLLCVTHPTMNETQLYDVSYFNLRNMLQGIPGVIAPAVYGGKLRNILAYVDPEKLAERNLSPMDVVRTLQQSNVLIPTGDAKLGDKDYQVVSNAQVEKVEDMNDFMIRARYGIPVSIGNVGQVQDSHAIQTNIARVDGKHQVYVPIYRQPGANTLQVLDSIKNALQKIKARLPEGIDFKLVADQSIFVRRAISSLTGEVILGGLLAASMVFFFLGEWRASFVALLTIPLSILGCFLGLRMTGETVNSMTLGGIALSVGVLIDATIVVLENVMRRLGSDKDKQQAVLTGAAQVAMPVLVSSITIGIVFLPVVFLKGIGNFLFLPLAKSVVWAIGCSFFASLTLIPLYARRFLAGREPSGEPAWFSRVARKYQELLVSALKRPVLILGCAASFFLLSLTLFPLLGTELFPKVDVGHISVKVRLPTGTRIEKTEETIAKVEDQVREVIGPDVVKTVISNLGVLYDWPAAYTPNSGPSDAFMEIELSDKRSYSTEEYASQLRQKLSSAFPDVEFAFDTGGLLTAALNLGQAAPIIIQIGGNDLKVDSDLANQAAQVSRQVKGAVDVRVQERLDYPQIALDIDRSKAARLGLNTLDVVQNVVTSLNSSVNFFKNFWISPKNGNHYFLGAQYPEEAISRDSILDIPITGSNQSRVVRLREVATLREKTAPSEVRHLNIRRTMSVLVDTHGRDVGSVAADIQKKLKEIPIPPGYEMNLGGEVKQMKDSFTNLGWGILLAVALVYLVLAGQFRSFSDPLMILVSVPLGFSGVIITLLATKTSLCIPAFIGMIFMVGIAVQNGILLVEFANHGLERGLTPLQAILEAARTRLRPILMTAFAGLLGVLPMAVGIGHGAEGNTPLGRAVLGGLLVSTILTLFVLPSLFVILKSNRTKGKRGPLKGIALILIGLLVPVTLRAQENGPVQSLTWTQALQMAEKNPLIEQARQKVLSAGKKTGVVESEFFPKITIDALQSQGLPGSSGSTGIPGVVNSPFTKTPAIGFDATWTLWDFGRTAGALDAAEAGKKAAQENSRVVEEQMILKTLSAFIRCYQLAKLEEFTDKRIDDLTFIEKETSHYVRVGLRSPVDAELIKSSLNGLRAKKEELKGLKKVSDIELAESLNLKEVPDFQCVVEFSDNPALLPEAQWNELTEKMPEVLQAKAEWEQAKFMEGQADSEHWPKLVAVGSVGWLDGTRLVDDNWYSVGVALRFPLFDGFKSSSGAGEFHFESEAAKYRFESAQMVARSKLSSIYSLAQSFLEKLSYVQEQEKSAKEAYRLGRSRYLNREAELPEYRDSEAVYYKALDDSLQAETDVWKYLQMMELTTKMLSTPSH